MSLTIPPIPRHTLERVTKQMIRRLIPSEIRYISSLMPEEIRIYLTHMIQDISRQLRPIAAAKKVRVVTVPLVMSVMRQVSVTPVAHLQLVIPRAVFADLIREFSSDFLLYTVFDKDACALVQASCEYTIRKVMRKALWAMRATKQQTVMPRHFQLAKYRDQSLALSDRLRPVPQMVSYTRLMSSLGLSEVQREQVSALMNHVEAVLNNIQLELPYAVEFLFPGELAKHAVSAIKDDSKPLLPAKKGMGKVLTYIMYECAEWLRKGQADDNYDEELEELLDRLGVFM